jgi:hypothetical protein
LDAVDTSPVPDVSRSLARLAPRALTSPSQAGLASSDAFSCSSSRRYNGPYCIDGMPLEEHQSEGTGGSDWEYVSGWAFSSQAQRTAVAQYLSSAMGSAGWNGRLVNLYA